MAKSNHAQTPTPAQAPATPATPAPAKAKKPKKAIRVPAPQVLQDAVAKAATEAKVSPSIWIRDLVASHLKVTLPAVTRTRTTYASKDEKKAAQKARRASRAATVKRLLAALEAGTIKLEEGAPATPPSA